MDISACEKQLASVTEERDRLKKDSFVLDKQKAGHTNETLLKVRQHSIMYRLHHCMLPFDL